MKVLILLPASFIGVALANYNQSYNGAPNGFNNGSNTYGGMGSSFGVAGNTFNGAGSSFGTGNYGMESNYGGMGNNYGGMGNFGVPNTAYPFSQGMNTSGGYPNMYGSNPSLSDSNSDSASGQNTPSSRFGKLKSKFSSALSNLNLFQKSTDTSGENPPLETRNGKGRFVRK